MQSPTQPRPPACQPKNEAPRTGFHGVLAFLRDSMEESNSDSYRESMMSYMSATPCPICRGKRLRDARGEDRRPFHRRLYGSASQSRTVGGHQPQLHSASVAGGRAHPPRDRRAVGLYARRPGLPPWIAMQPRSPAAKVSASVWPRRSAPGFAACSTFWMSLQSAFISATTTV